MFRSRLAVGLSLLLLESGALAQTPVTSETSPHPSQLSPASPAPLQVPPHQPAPGYAPWVQQPPAGYEFIPTAPFPPVQPPHIHHSSAPPRRFPLEAVWDNGLFLESHDRQFRIHVGGNAQWDSTWLIGPQSVFAIPGGAQNGAANAAATFLRRARIRLDGEIFERFDYMVEYDLANAVNENKGLQAPS